MTKDEERPIMKQYREMKQKHPEALLLFRCGDFYEAYEDDAKACAEILGITLTVNSETGITLAGFPHHALDAYLPRLIRAGRRVAICDQLEDPKITKRLKERGITENTQNEKIMANEVKAADLIGKTIVNKEGTMKYHVINADGDNLQVEFLRGDNPPVNMPMPVSQVEKLLAGGWTIAAEEHATGNDSVEDVTDVNPEPVKVRVKVKTPKTKAKVKAEPKPETEPKNESPKKEVGKYTFEEYTTAKGKTGAKIMGVQETDAVYQQASSIHAAASFTRDKKGTKHFYLCFGPRYLDAARQVCAEMNAGKGLEELKAIVDAATEERHQKREEWKARRADHNADGKTYTEAEVRDLLKRFCDGEQDAVAEVQQIIAA